jgi:hypothetical protein
MSRTIVTAVVLIFLSLRLTACGDSPGDRPASGSGIAAVGGIMTSSRDVNLGRPVWR